MQNMEEITVLIKDVGFPIASAIGAGAGVWWMISWLKSALSAKLDAQFNMIVKLIDRIRILDNDIIRMETMIRLMKDLDPDYERLGKRDPEDSRKD